MAIPPRRRRRRRRSLAPGALRSGSGSAFTTGRPRPPARPARLAPGALRSSSGSAFVTGRPYSPPQQAAPPRVPSAGEIAQQPGDLSGGVGAGYDVNSDPAVAAAQGLAAKIRAQAQATALAKREQAAIEYGDPEGVQGISAKGSKAARENPFSVLKNLEHGYGTGLRDLEEGLNSANLFYSGYRGQQLGEAARGYQQSRYQAGTNFRGLMTDINDQLAEALLNADMYEANALLGSSGGGWDDGGYGGGDTDTRSNAAYPSKAAGPGLRPKPRRPPRRWRRRRGGGGARPVGIY